MACSDQVSSEDASASVTFNVPKQEDAVVNNKKELFKFQFDYIFPMSAQQEDVFNLVAKPVADRYMC